MNVYQEPYKLPAGLLALSVHAAFFALLYFGFSWQTQPRSPSVMSVELWQSLPEAEPAAPAPSVKALVETPPPVPVEEVIKPDIVIPEKKPKPVVKHEEKPLKKPEVKPEIKPKLTPKVTHEARTNAWPGIKSGGQTGKAGQPSAAEQQAAQERADQEAATGRVVDEYKAKIQAKIKHNVIRPPNVADDARAEYMVTVLPDGSVLPPRLARSSGNEAYDNAVERAILKSQPLPLPPDAGLFNRFRELKLSFKPVE